MRGKEQRTERMVSYALLWINVVIALLQLSAGNGGMVILHAAVIIILGYNIRREEKER